MAIVWVVAVACCFVASHALPNGFEIRALAGVDHLVECKYQNNSGVFANEGLWQSGNTIETLSNALAYYNNFTQASAWLDLLDNTYARTPEIVDNCFDDHQWWLLGWLRAYNATSRMLYLQRAARIFDYIVNKAWSSEICGGGVIWCPTVEQTRARLKQMGMPAERINGPYKNAITNELFLSSAMGLHPYARRLGRPADYYLTWAQKEWQWFEGSGMINAETNLINDGLTDDCKNNGGVTWTYNQGVLLSGLAELALATGNQSLLTRAQLTVQAVQAHLTDRITGILLEPCNGECDQDQHLFKGIFMRHLGYLDQLDAHSASLFDSYVVHNAASAVTVDKCTDGGYGLDWRGPCVVQDTATSSSALDVIISASKSAQAKAWRGSAFDGGDTGLAPLGQGNCADDHGQSMADCYRAGIPEAECAAQTVADSHAVAYDIMTSCSGYTFCRVRTLGGSSACPPLWTYEPGSATTVTTTTPASLTLCVLKINATTFT